MSAHSGLPWLAITGLALGAACGSGSGVAAPDAATTIPDAAASSSSGAAASSSGGVTDAMPPAPDADVVDASSHEGGADCLDFTADTFADEGIGSEENLQITHAYGTWLTPSLDGARARLYVGLVSGGFDAGYGAPGEYQLGGAIGASVNARLDDCEQCVSILTDKNVRFYVSQGSLHVAAIGAGQLQGTLSDLVLQEVRLSQETATWAPAPGGRCAKVHAVAISYAVATPPPTWTCAAAFYNDSVCDCGCGAPDPRCGAAAPEACGRCDTCGSAGQRGAVCADRVEPANPASCLEDRPTAWTCHPSYFYDGLCDCGCGAFDEHDCASANASACEDCSFHCPLNQGDCSAKISATQNWMCLP